MIAAIALALATVLLVVLLVVAPARLRQRDRWPASLGVLRIRRARSK